MVNYIHAYLSGKLTDFKAFIAITIVDYIFFRQHFRVPLYKSRLGVCLIMLRRLRRAQIFEILLMNF